VVRTPKRKEMKLVTLESKRTAEDLPHLARRIQSAVQVMESGLFTPAPVDAWWCSKRFCGYWNICPYAARPVSVGASGLLNDFIEMRTNA
jgi:hypothetical protein